MCWERGRPGRPGSVTPGQPASLPLFSRRHVAMVFPRTSPASALGAVSVAFTVEDGKARLEDVQARMFATIDRIDAGLAVLWNDNLERRYRDHAGAYFGRLLRRA